MSLFQSDLVHTIGESAALGASGVILWGSSEYARSQVTETEWLLLFKAIHICSFLSVEACQ